MNGLQPKMNGLGRAGKARVVIGGVAAAVAGAVLIALSNTRATVVEEGGEDTEPPIGQWTNHAGGYYMCGHMCGKKVNPTIMSHDCCGRCRIGRDCQRAAHRDYDGPGTFAHNYFEVSLRGAAMSLSLRNTVSASLRSAFESARV
ncbi:hypothetical protein [Streptomyces sp. NPDC005078]|uniref:hypothetical protein n=1 Tax=unclassified Streptomyces TaxID=2593676 RepID=UPI0033A1A7FF